MIEGSVTSAQAHVPVVVKKAAAIRNLSGLYMYLSDWRVMNEWEHRGHVNILTESQRYLWGYNATWGVTMPGGWFPPRKPCFTEGGKRER